MRITEEQAEAFFRQDIQNYIVYMRKAITVDLTQNQFDALCSFHYNLGPYILQNSKLLCLINSCQMQAAANEMKLCNKVNGTVIDDLVRRRNAEAGLFLSMYHPHHPDPNTQQPNTQQTNNSQPKPQQCQIHYPIPRRSVDELAREVIAGHWGTGKEIRNCLTDAGYQRLWAL